MQKVLHETCQQYVTRRLSEGWRIAGRWRHLVILSPPDGNFLRVVDLRNDVETLRPNAAGDSTQWVPVGGTINWQMVDEETHDDLTTYVKKHIIPYLNQKDLYNIANSAGSGTINFVKLYAWCQQHAAYAYQLYIGIKSGATESWGTVINAGPPWTEYTRQFNTDPNTGLAWMRAAIDALQIGVATKEEDDAGGRCTQVYVEVDYTPPKRSYGYIIG